MYEEVEKDTLSFGLINFIHFESPVGGILQKPVVQGLTVAKISTERYYPSLADRMTGSLNRFIPATFHKFPVSVVSKNIRSRQEETGKYINILIWENMIIEKQEEDSDDSEELLEFSDIDDFNQSDIYAVDDMDDVWHYDSKCWTSCKFLSE